MRVVCRRRGERGGANGESLSALVSELFVYKQLTRRLRSRRNEASHAFDRPRLFVARSTFLSNESNAVAVAFTVAEKTAYKQLILQNSSRLNEAPERRSAKDFFSRTSPALSIGGLEKIFAVLGSTPATVGPRFFGRATSSYNASNGE